MCSFGSAFVSFCFSAPPAAVVHEAAGNNAASTAKTENAGVRIVIGISLLGFLGLNFCLARFWPEVCSPISPMKGKAATPYWSGRVTRESNALDLEKNVFSGED